MRLFLKIAKLTASLSLALSFSSALANDGPDWLDDPNRLPQGVVTNDNVMIKKDSSAMSLMMQAERALKSDHIDRAIDLVRRSLELNQEDLDAHMCLAKALERKLGTQKVEDPKIFNECVKEWLAVLRNQYGEEKSETLGGIGLPGINGRFFADDDRQNPARSHLIKLTGTSPKLWETNARFLAKVERHGEATVSGKMVQNRDAASDGENTPRKSARPATGRDPYPEAQAPVGKTSAKPGADTN